jgi:uncharacterized membrane protein
MQMILTMVGIGVGLSTVDVAAAEAPSSASFSVGAGIWWVISGILAAAVGGYIAGRLSGKASQSTTAYHGLIAWAVSTHLPALSFLVPFVHREQKEWDAERL